MEQMRAVNNWRVVIWIPIKYRLDEGVRGGQRQISCILVIESALAR